jgi:hypothetical protein
MELAELVLNFFPNKPAANSAAGVTRVLVGEDKRKVRSAFVDPFLDVAASLLSCLRDAVEMDVPRFK